jgi:phosphoenolpyruvate carboxykinase (GTP)
MAMLPFCGYHMGDYFAHWLAMGKRLADPPKIFHVNWFRTDERGRFLWPGYGENARVLEWILERCRGEGKARGTPIGFVPTLDGLNLDGLDLPRPALEELLAVRPEDWRAELAEHKKFLDSLGKRLPIELVRQQEALAWRLGGRAVPAPQGG